MSITKYEVANPDFVGYPPSLEGQTEEYLADMREEMVKQGNAEADGWFRHIDSNPEWIKENE